jgi:hypothetical protein
MPPLPKTPITTAPIVGPALKFNPLGELGIDESKPVTLEDLGIEVPKPVAPIPMVVSIGLGKQPVIEKKPETIVDQINNKLKEVIINIPDEKRDIHLEDNGHEGVTVWVGLEKFSGVDAVPYPDVQRLIRTAVSNWENDIEKKNKE